MSAGSSLPRQGSTRRRPRGTAPSRHTRDSLAKLTDAVTRRSAHLAPSSRCRLNTGDDAQLHAVTLPEFECWLVEFLMHASGAPRIGTAASRLCRLALEHQQGLERAVTALSRRPGRRSSCSVGPRTAVLCSLRPRTLGFEQSVELALARYLTEAQRNVHVCLGAIRREAAAITRLPDFPNEAYIEQLRTVLDETCTLSSCPPPRQNAAACAALPCTPSPWWGDRPPPTRTGGGPLRDHLAMPAAETDPAASHLGGIVGGFIGAALLGPFGSIPFAMLGGWLGSVFGAKPPAQRIEATLSKTLSEIEERAQAVLEASATSSVPGHQQGPRSGAPVGRTTPQRGRGVAQVVRYDAATRHAQARSVRARLGDIQDIVLARRPGGPQR